MPLTRATMTAASRIMLPAYVAFTAWLGYQYLVDPTGRIARSHGLVYPRQVMGGTMAPWGWVFLGLAALMLVALIVKHRGAFALALGMGVVIFGIWTGCSIKSMALDPTVAPTAPVVWLFIATACLASLVSLVADER